MKYLVFASLLTIGAFASSCHPDYECCKGCDVFTTDEEAQWGIENDQWCVIEQSKCIGYPLCTGCDEYLTDETGRWGIENNDWCLINESKCNSSGGVDFKRVIPVISLISESGNSDFATKPVEKHIARQAYFGKQMPPEPYYEECSITVEDASGNTLIDSAKGKVKVRGNWTSNYVKKSLRINFDKSQNMLDLNGGKKFKSWVLLAEYKDGSLLRNKSSFTMSREILGKDGLYSSDSQLVELRINDEYFGVYLLAEVQQVNDGRVNISKVPDNYEGTDVGYFLEYDIGYSMYEEKIETLTIDYNNNAPLKPYDGNNGSGTTIKPLENGFGGWGGNSNNPWGGNGNTNPWGGNNNNPGGKGNTNPWGGNSNNPGGNGNTNPWGGNNNNPGGKGNNNPWGGNSNNPWGGNGNTNPWGGNNNNPWGGGSSENMTIKSDVNSQEQHDFIFNFVNGAYKIMYEAAYNQKTLKFNKDYSKIVDAPELTPREAIENVLDAESLADLFIISELTCDADLFYSSFYLDADFGANGSKKLRFEAPWDFDSGLGNRDRCPNGQGHYAANGMQSTIGIGKRVNPWLTVIMYEKWYQDIIKEKWTKAYESGIFDRVIDMIHSDTENAAEAIDRNYEKWNNIIDNHSFASELSPDAKKCKTQKEAADYLARWLGNRVKFINSNWHK